MDAISDPSIEDVVFIKSAQVGASEILLNTVAYFADYDPAPMLMVQPTIEMAESFSKDRVAPMIRDTPCLKQRFGSVASRDADNTVLHKSFPGGYLALAGANSAKSLSSRPVRIVLFDEVDRAPLSAGTEGDPVSLAEKRTNNFPNRKRIKVSTPTIKGFSRIEAAFNESDKRRFHVACPHCKTPHVLNWGNVVWPNGEPEKAQMKCPICTKEFNDAQKNEAVRTARGAGLGWIATTPFKGVAGFHINELYSPWRRLSEIVDDFLKAKEFPERLQVWINTSLGETFDDAGESLSESVLMERRENYASDVPGRVLALTYGADVQPNRIEAELVGWGAGDESWSIDYRVFFGDTDVPEGGHGSPWTAFSKWRRTARTHETQGTMPIWGGCIDSGGHNTQAVYEYGRKWKHERIFVIKGKGGTDVPIVSAPSQKRSGKVRRPVPLFTLGVDQIKDMVQRRLRVKEPGAPGYCHFPADARHEIEFFAQLTSEKKIIEKDKHGRSRRVWKLIEGRRNEVLDCRVYNIGAITLMQPDYGKLAFKGKVKVAQAAQSEPPKEEAKLLLQDMVEAAKEQAPAAESSTESTQDPPEAPEHNPLKKRKPLRRNRGSFLNRW